MVLTTLFKKMPYRKPEPETPKAPHKPAFDIKTENVGGVHKTTVTRLVDADIGSIGERDDHLAGLPTVEPYVE